MAGVTGRRIDVAFGRSSTWGVPATVTQQILIDSSEGFDDMPDMVVDESFGQDFIGAGEVGDRQPIKPSLGVQYRFDQGPDVFMAATMGSSAAPTVVSSQAATSLVAYQHIMTLSPELTHFFTLATNFQNYVQEIRTFKVLGFGMSIGQNGRINCSFPIVGDRTTYTPDSVNSSTSINAAIPSTPGSRAFRRFTRLRMNVASGGALGAADEQTVVSDLKIDVTRPLAEDFVLNRDSIIEADDDGLWEGKLTLTFARMTSVAANSLQAGLAAAREFKCDIQMLGTYINSTTQRSLLLEMPNLQVASGGYKAVVVGHGQVRPEVVFDMRLASVAPTGMAGLVYPLRATLVNARAANLLA